MFRYQYEEYEDYWTHNDMFIIKPHFDKCIISDLIEKKFCKLIFTNYDDFNCSILEYYNTEQFINRFNMGIFNKLVDNLPPHLIQIIFGYNFNQCVDNLPKLLIYLSFSVNFNQLVNNLPNQLTHLEFGYSFNQSIDNLPSSLTHLKLDINYNMSIENLPNSIILLIIYSYYSRPLNNLPPTCKIIRY